MGYHLGVDLGTTYTAAALARGERAEAATLGTRSVSIPSVVYLGPSGEELLIGEAAARRAATEPQRVAREFKRRVGDPTPLLLGGSPVGAELLMGRMLDWVVRRVVETEGSQPDSLAVTHPANWGRYKLDLLTQAIHHVGLAADHLVPEPAAAAAFYASQRDLAPGSVVAVYDLGGGTFDAAVVRVATDGFHLVGKPDGIERMGGIDFDHAVLRHVATTVGVDLDDYDTGDPAAAASLVQLHHDCVEAKEALSSDLDVSIPVILPTLHTEVRLTRDELESMIRPALNETVVALRRAVASADVAVEDVTAVLLVGGSSRIPLVAQLVGAELGRPVAIDARPKDAISMGAALLAAQKARPAGSSPPASAAQAPVAAKAPLPPPPVGPPASGRPAGPVAYSAPQPHPQPAGAGAGAGGGSNRLYLALAGAAVAVIVVIALIATRGGGGDDDQAGDDTATTTTSLAGDPTTTEDPLGGILDIDPSDIGTDVPPPEPLPGDDWSEEARGQFVTDCSGTVGAALGLAGTDADQACGCIYDGSQEAGIPFADFNEQWSAEDMDTTSPAGQQILNDSATCAFEILDGV